MKYYIAYPIAKTCDLHCPYCFHSEYHNGKQEEPRIFTFKDYCRFRDTYLKDAEDIIVHFHGGETYLNNNAAMIKDFMDGTTKERVDLLTNGIQEYKTIESYKNRVNRIGLTYHRKMIGNNEVLNKRFKDNALYLKSLGIPVYIKELLFSGSLQAIYESKKEWERLGYQYKIQDFKGMDRGRSFEEWEKYTPEDILAIDNEYKRGGTTCACMQGYTNILIRGGWCDGDVLACWEDPVVIGNIQDNTYMPGYTICKNFKNGVIDVDGVPKVYRGTYDRDLYKPPSCPS